MRFAVVAATTVLLLGSAAPVLAGGAQRLDGYVYVEGGINTFDQGFNDGSHKLAHGPAYEVGGSTEMAITPSLGVQGDLSFRDRRAPYDDDPDGGVGDQQVNATMHAFYRDPGAFLIGAVGQYAVASQLNLSHLDTPFTTIRTYAGGEAQGYLGDFVLYAQAAYEHRVRQDAGDDGATSGWIGDVEARYYLQPNMEIGAHVGRETMAYDSQPDSTVTVTSGGLALEFQPENMPFSAFAKYDVFNQATAGLSNDQWYQRVLVGLKFNFDDTTLEDRAHSGASLKPFESYNNPNLF